MITLPPPILAGYIIVLNLRGTASDNLKIPADSSKPTFCGEIIVSVLSVTDPARSYYEVPVMESILFE